MGAEAIGLMDRGRREIHALDGVSSGRFRIASLTKPFTSVAALAAARTRSVPLDTPVIDVLTNLAPSWAADPGITIRPVLAQTSGLSSRLTGADVALLPDDEEAVHTAARMTVACGSKRAPGQRWEYYNGNYFLAGAVIEELAGVSYESALLELVLDPSGLTATGLLSETGLVSGVVAGAPLEDARYPRGRRPSGGLISTVDDILTFVDHLFAAQDLLNEIATPHTPLYDPMRYGLGWAIGPSDQMYLNGRLPGYRAAMPALPEHGFAAVALTARDDALPVIAGWLSDAQRPLTGDDFTDAITDFAV